MWLLFASAECHRVKTVHPKNMKQNYKHNSNRQHESPCSFQNSVKWAPTTGVPEFDRWPRSFLFISFLESTSIKTFSMEKVVHCLPSLKYPTTFTKKIKWNILQENRNMLHCSYHCFSSSKNHTKFEQIMVKRNLPYNCKPDKRSNGIGTMIKIVPGRMHKVSQDKQINHNKKFKYLLEGDFLTQKINPVHDSQVRKDI